MPVKAVGNRVVEIMGGKTVAHATSKKNAAISAWIRNEAIKKKERKY